MENELHELFLEELADIHSAEKQLTMALPKIAKAANSDELRDAIKAHLKETEQHVRNVEKAFKALDETPKRKKCHGMEALIKEGDEMIKELKDSPALDAAIIAGAQKVEHYEIASYGTLCAWAEQMGHNEALALLKENLGQEKEADEKLTSIAESLANATAEQTA